MTEENTEITIVETEEQVSLRIKEDINAIIGTAKSVANKALVIKNQGGWEAFWHKSENIQSLASYTNDMALLHQKTINLLALLLSGTVRMKQDYTEIMETIEVLSKEESDVQILAYLLDLGKSIKLINTHHNFISDEFDRLDTEMKNIRRINDEITRDNKIQFEKFADKIKKISLKIESLMRENRDSIDIIENKLGKIEEENRNGINLLDGKLERIEEEHNNTNHKINNLHNKGKSVIIGFCMVLGLIIIYEIIKIIL